MPNRERISEEKDYHESCNAPLSPLCISESFDGGGTWRQFNGPPISGNDLGGDGGGPALIDAKQMFFQHPTGGVWYSNDDGKTWVQHPLPGGPPEALYVGPSGSLYVGVGNTGIFRLQNPTAPIQAKAWQLLPGAPMSTTMLETGSTFYASWSWDTAEQPIFTAPMSDLTKWTRGTSASAMKRAANVFAYDSAHEIVYAANMGGGLWRLHQ